MNAIESNINAILVPETWYMVFVVVVAYCACVLLQFMNILQDKNIE